MTTPAQQRGINEGDWCEVVGGPDAPVGTRIYLVHDDDTDMPKFSSKEKHHFYVELKDVRKLEESSHLEQENDLQNALDHLDKAVESLETYARNGNYDRRLSDTYRWASHTKALLFSAIMDKNRE